MVVLDAEFLCGVVQMFAAMESSEDETGNHDEDEYEKLEAAPAHAGSDASTGSYFSLLVLQVR